MPTDPLGGVPAPFPGWLRQSSVEDAPWIVPISGGPVDVVEAREFTEPYRLTAMAEVVPPLWLSGRDLAAVRVRWWGMTFNDGALTPPVLGGFVVAAEDGEGGLDIEVGMDRCAAANATGVTRAFADRLVNRLNPDSPDEAHTPSSTHSTLMFGYRPSAFGEGLADLGGLDLAAAKEILMPTLAAQVVRSVAMFLLHPRFFGGPQAENACARLAGWVDAPHFLRFQMQLALDACRGAWLGSTAVGAQHVARAGHVDARHLAKRPLS